MIEKELKICLSEQREERAVSERRVPNYVKLYIHQIKKYFKKTGGNFMKTETIDFKYFMNVNTVTTLEEIFDCCPIQLHQVYF
ncbi:hypothetical protein KHA80_06390 [Anaerobacillus sp. HL2]|nr:hypothetical protein KHA80_06390 [Anaerobacillus sp. HL2]